MTDQEKLKYCFEEVIWMAIRYADGRSTYAPHVVRDAIKKFQEVYPDWKPRKDRTLKPIPKELESFQFKGDFLIDLLDK